MKTAQLIVNRFKAAGVDLEAADVRAPLNYCCYYSYYSFPSLQLSGTSESPESEVKVKVWLALAVYLGGPEVSLAMGSLHANGASPL